MLKNWFVVSSSVQQAVWCQNCPRALGNVLTPYQKLLDFPPP